MSACLLNVMQTRCLPYCASDRIQPLNFNLMTFTTLVLYIIWWQYEAGRKIPTITTPSGRLRHDGLVSSGLSRVTVARTDLQERTFENQGLSARNLGMIQ
jgi:hypothetical protein